MRFGATINFGVDAGYRCNCSNVDAMQPLVVTWLRGIAD